MKRLRPSALVFLIVIAAFCTALFVQHDRDSRLEAAVRREAELQAGLEVMKMALAPYVAPAPQSKQTCAMEENVAETNDGDDDALAILPSYDEHKVSDIIKKLVNLEDPYRSSQAYRLLFATTGVGGLSRLRTVRRRFHCDSVCMGSGHPDGARQRRRFVLSAGFAEAQLVSRIPSGTRKGIAA